MELRICLPLLGIGFLGIGFLDGRVPPHQNVSVRGRLFAIVIMLAVLAFAETRSGDQIPTAQPRSNAASSQLADPPIPDPDFPIITAAVSTSATVQTVLVVESRRQLRPALSVSTVSLRLPGVGHSTDKPRFFPLLI